MSLGKCTGYQKVKNKVIIQTEKGNVTLNFLTEQIVNIFFPVKDAVQDSKAIENLIEKNVELTLSEIESEGEIRLVVKTNCLTVEIDSPFKLIFKDPAGQVINEDYLDIGINLSKPIGVYKTLKPAEHFYGFGEKAGFLDKAGEKFEMWCKDIPEPHVPSMKALYKSIPFFISLTEGIAYGIFFDNSFKTYFDLGNTSQKYYSFTAEGGNIDYYFLYGPDIKEVLRGYTDLTGRISLPPLWALGYQQSRWGYYPEEKVYELANTFRQKDIPCDVLYLDIDYMEGFRVFTWDHERFPDPKKMTDKLQEQGFKVVTIVDPGVKIDPDYQVYRELLKNHYYVTDKDGLPYNGRVWPGECLFPDFTDTSVREWWGRQHQMLIDAGIAGIWNDMNEPAVFTEGKKEPDEYKTMPKSNIHKNDGRKASHAEMHNVYGLMMSKSTYEGLRKLSDKRPFVVSRAAYAGVQKYAALWTGDNHSFWDHLGMALPMCMNLGMSGVPFIGTDVGGFGSDCDGELLSRWVQVGAFTPFFRNHSAWNTHPQEPWAFDAKTEMINRKYIKLRYKLLPYIYNLFFEASMTGLPLMRPLVLEFPSDPEVYRIYDQFMFGSNMLIAPIITPGTAYRHVYLPTGEWVDYWTGKQYIGQKRILVNAPLDVLPIFVKRGSIIPNYAEQSYVGEKPLTAITMEIYPGNGQYDLYLDDGETFAYQEGKYNLYNFNLEEKAETLTLSISTKYCGFLAKLERFILEFKGLLAGQVWINGSLAESAVGEDSLTVQISSDFTGEIKIIL